MEMGPISLVRIVALLFIIPIASLASASPVFVEPAAGLRVGFYNSTCPQAESIIRDVVKKHFTSNPAVTGQLLRLFFHDCFVEGCDASLLIDPIEGGQQSELSVETNFLIRGLDVVADIKSSLEAACPSTVSCADALALATRDSVVLAGGLDYPVATGKRDSRVSDPKNVDIPPTTDPAAIAIKKINEKLNFTVEETVALFGAHSVGVIGCLEVTVRLYDMVDYSKGVPSLDVPLTTTGKPDRTMDPDLRKTLIGLCPLDQVIDNFTVFLDQKKPYTLDSAYYQNLLLNKGVAMIDQSLNKELSARPYISKFASNETLFLNKFAEVLVKLGNYRVLVGNEGEVRNKCNAFN